MKKTIFHVDMDAFYASVEQNDFPGYRGKPVIIGTMPGHRGVVSACSYEARRYGVHSAQPVSQAYRLCPQGIYLPVRMERYQEISRQIMSLFDNYTPGVMQVSIDEAFLDMTGTERLYGKALDIGRRIKEEVKSRFGLNISIGISFNFFLAKLASDASKPDGLLQVEKDDVIPFLNSLPLKDLWGVGKKTRERLSDLNLSTVAEIRKLDSETLVRMLGQGTGSFLYNAVRGIDPGIYQQEIKSHSISTETTYAEDTKDSEGISKTLLDMAHQIMFRLFNSQFNGKTIVLKLRYASFETHTIQKTLPYNIHSAEEIYHTALELLNKKWNRSSEIRLIGLGLSNLQKNGSPEQNRLFEDPYDKKKKVEKTIHEIRLHGNKVTKASLLGKKKTD
ncbi:MAG: DNA polymerase IV [Spirochaetales bacterium]|nr:DNA polymerase IV [Spirochaetales bacterium]